MADVGAQIYRYLRGAPGLRLSPAQAAGFLGNTMQESSNNPSAAGGGLIQGQGGRTSHGTLQQQLAGIRRELLGPERATLQALRGVSDPRAAARLISERFERPGVPMLANREKYALQALRKYGGLAPAASWSEGGGQGGGGFTREALQLGQGPGETPAQSADMAQLLAALSSTGPSTSVEGLTVPKPTEPRPAGLRIPQAPVEQPQPSSSDLLGIIARLGQDSSSELAPIEGGQLIPTGEGGAGGGGGQAPVTGPGPGKFGALAGSGLTYAGPDQGVDFTGRGNVRAPARVQITRVVPSGSGWSGEGGLLAAKILDGPEAGRFMYIAEDFHPAAHLRPGSIVPAGGSLGLATGSGRAPGIEVGFAQNAHGQAYGTTHDGKPGGPAPVYGRQFEQYLQRAARRR